MLNLNKCFLSGNVGQDPELRVVGTDNTVMNFSLATQSGFKDKDGQWQNKTQWHRVTYWKPTDHIKENLVKGKQVFVEGRIEYQKYNDKDGVERYVTNIIAEKVQLVEKTSSSGNSDSNNPVDRALDAYKVMHSDDIENATEEDLPF